MNLHALPRLVGFAALSLGAAPALHGQWTTFTLPTPRDGVGVAAGNGKVYFAGGADPVTFAATDVIDVYDEATGTWTVLTMPSAQSFGVEAAVVGDKLCVGAGLGPGFTPGDVHIYDTVGGGWTTKTLSPARLDTAFVAAGPFLVIAGGFDSTFGPMWFDAVDIYDSISGTWSTATLPTKASEIAGVHDGFGSVLLAGGRDMTAFFTDTVQEVVAPIAMTSTFGTLSDTRTAISAAKLGDKIYFVGGLDNLSQASVVVDIYDTLGGMWTTDTLPFGIVSGSAAVVGNTMIVPPGFGSTDGYFIDGTSGAITPTTMPFGATGGLTATASDTAAYLAGGGGQILVYTPCPAQAASETVRLGTPANPSALLPGATGAPIVGSTWDPVIDHSSFAPAAIFDFLAVSATSSNIASPLGTILCGVSPFLVVSNPSPGSPFAVAIPGDCVNVGLALCTQGASISASGSIELANALDIVIGTF